jgi:hypothetical protein
MLDENGLAEGSRAAGLLCAVFFFFVSLLVVVAALTGVTIGATTSAVAEMDSIKSRIASLLMRLSCSAESPKQTQPRAAAKIPAGMPKVEPFKIYRDFANVCHGGQ